MLHDTRTYPHGCVATPHHLASSAGAAILQRGGNAVDAAVAANLVLAVVTPYHCGLGGDLFALVVRGDEVTGHASNGRAPAGATLERIREAAGDGRMPTTGALTVPVPGAVAGWFTLLERHGTRSFGELAGVAIAIARDGVVLTAHAAGYFERSRPRFADQAEWTRRFGALGGGSLLRQPDLAEALELLAHDGPEAFYGGRIGASIVEALQAGGSPMTLDDLRSHEPREVDPLSGWFGGAEVLELPPPTQGVTALEALGLAELLDAPDDELARTHLLIEAARVAMADRRHVTDPEHMAVSPAGLLDAERLRELADGIDPARAAAWPPSRSAPGGTAYLCAADADGNAISLIQSNFMGFGSGVVDPTYGINLQNRGAQFSLDTDDANVIAPRKRPLHTLIPGLVRREGRPWLVFGTMGGDAQPQIHLQVLDRVLRRGEDLAAAIDAPRWVVSPSDGTVAIESRVDPAVVDGLRERGHVVTVLGGREHGMGHAHAIEIGAHGFRAASDPRAEGAATGW